MILKEPQQQETNLETECLLQNVPMKFWALSSMDIGKIKLAIPVKITIDNTLPLLNFCQYPLRLDALARIKLIIQNYLKRGLIIPCTSPCNTPILLVKKPNGKEWTFVQYLRAINKIVIPRHPVVPNPHTLLPTIPMYCQ